MEFRKVIKNKKYHCITKGCKFEKRTETNFSCAVPTRKTTRHCTVHDVQVCLTCGWEVGWHYGEWNRTLLPIHVSKTIKKITDSKYKPITLGKLKHGSKLITKSGIERTVIEVNGINIRLKSENRRGYVDYTIHHLRSMRYTLLE